MPYGTEYPFGHFRPAALVHSLPAPCAPNSLPDQAAQDEKQKHSWLSAALLSNN